MQINTPRNISTYVNKRSFSGYKHFLKVKKKKRSGGTTFTGSQHILKTLHISVENLNYAIVDGKVFLFKNRR